MNRMPGLVRLLEQQLESTHEELVRLKQHKQNGVKFVDNFHDAKIAQYTKNEAELRKWINKLTAVDADDWLDKEIDRHFPGSEADNSH